MTKKEADELKKQLELLQKLPAELIQKLETKLRIARGQYSKFCDDMIKENSAIHRINATAERQKVRDYEEILHILVNLQVDLASEEESVELKTHK